MYYEKYRSANLGCDVCYSQTTKLSISGASIFVKHQLRIYPDKQEKFLALTPDLMNDTKSIEAEFKIEVWDNALNGQKLHDKTCKHTFLSTTAGYGIDVNASGLKEIQAIFTLTKWLVTKK